MKFGFNLEAILGALGGMFVLFAQAIALAFQVLLFVANIAALTFTAAGTCFLLFAFYKASGDSLFLPVVLALAVAGVVSYEIYDRRHGWQPVNVNR